MSMSKKQEEYLKVAERTAIRLKMEAVKVNVNEFKRKNKRKKWTRNEGYGKKAVEGEMAMIHT